MTIKLRFLYSKNTRSIYEVYVGKTDITVQFLYMTMLVKYTSEEIAFKMIVYEVRKEHLEFLCHRPKLLIKFSTLHSAISAVHFTIVLSTGILKNQAYV